MSEQLNAAIAAAKEKLSGAKPESVSKTYYSRFPGSCFIDSKVVRHVFIGGKLVVTDEQLIKELDEVCDKVGSPVYTKDPVITESDRAPGEENAQNAAAVMLQLQQAQQALLAR